jgi:hypothetical protein
MQFCLKLCLRVSCLFTAFLSLSAAAFGAECLSLSPTLQAGKNPYVAIVVRELAPDEKEILGRVFGSLPGSWKGSAESFFCRSAENPEDVAKDVESGKVRISVDYDGNLVMTADFYSDRDRTGRQEQLNLFRNDNRLRFDHDTGAGDVELIEISDARIAFLYRRVLQMGRGSSRREHYFTLALDGGAITIDRKLYIQGKLSSGEVWRLKKE